MSDINKLLEAAEAAVWICELATQKLSWDSGLYRSLQKKDAPLADSLAAWLDWVHPEDRDRVQGEILAIQKSEGTLFQSQFRVLSPSGSLRHIQSRGHVDRRAAHPKLACLHFDVTTQTCLQKDSLGKNDFTSMPHDIGKMAGSVAHEINNPLSIILGTVSQLQRDLRKGREIKEGALSESLERIVTTVERISRIVKSLRNFSRD